MKRHISILLVGVCAYAAGAGQTVIFPPHLSGQQLVKQWRGGPGLPSEWPLREQEEQVYAQGYLAGVVDLTQGQAWCSPASMEPGERDDRAVTALERAKVQSNAAKALLAQYVARFPCP